MDISISSLISTLLCLISTLFPSNLADVSSVLINPISVSTAFPILSMYF